MLLMGALSSQCTCVPPPCSVTPGGCGSLWVDTGLGLLTPRPDTTKTHGHIPVVLALPPLSLPPSISPSFPRSLLPFPLTLLYPLTCSLPFPLFFNQVLRDLFWIGHTSKQALTKNKKQISNQLKTTLNFNKDLEKFIKNREKETLQEWSQCNRMPP